MQEEALQIYAESKKAIDLDIADINATTLKIKGEFYLVEISRLQYRQYI